MDVSATVIATLTASAVGAITSIAVGVYTTRFHRKQKLIAHVDRIVDLAIEYPYLEDDGFCAKWPGLDEDERYMRYDNYCCQVFNLLERAWIFSRGNTDVMTDIVYFEELMYRHKNWWNSQRNNKGGYHIGFLKFADQILNGKDAE